MLPTVAYKPVALMEYKPVPVSSVGGVLPASDSTARQADPRQSARPTQVERRTSGTPRYHNP